MATLTEQLTTPQQSGAAVRIENLTRSYGSRVVLDDLTLDIAAGQFVALLGRSGSGKSTLLRALAGLDHDVRGDGRLSVPARVSVAFQDSRLLPWKRLADNVILGSPGGADAKRRASEVIAEVGLGGRERAWPNQLSGGEQQRAALARALVNEPELLLADEPFGALDALTRIRMHELLRDLVQRHRPAVLLVTHDVDEAIVLADRVVVLDSGVISQDVTIDLPHPRAYGDPQLAGYRQRLLAALGVRPGTRE
ncbi:ABC transporter ATP-binding protein [Nocardia stercoris]|uniref:ABC transporter ATP-binding protein n=1 Tax=Nocardia stercoris TaxID=2483361 RepID=A0A3M2L497_9NOCA|nr:ABC transporter ATP-binding protein [Nocardia stercoris]RMI31333.1 ABC transporter ATP-binding protein [Nocardia stercoris]